MLCKRGKKGQATLFIIIAIVIVAVVVLALILVPKLFPRGIGPAKPIDPEAYIGDCVNLALEPSVETLASQGGSLELGNCIVYKDVCRHYLCYSSINYAACVNQEPLLKEKIEQILKTKLGNVVSSCINSFSNSATQQGYEVSICSNPKFNVTLTEGKINVPIECSMTLSKGESVKRVDKINPFLKWPLFEFVTLTKQIINEEIANTDFNPFYYMLKHYSIEIEKFRTSEGSKIYILRERTSGKEFGFAVRNYVLPGGIN